MNQVNIIGILKDNIDEYLRYFEYERPCEQEGIRKAAIIPTKFWTEQPNSRLITLPNNTRVAISGRLDTHDKFDVILICEELQVLK